MQSFETIFVEAAIETAKQLGVNLSASLEAAGRKATGKTASAIEVEQVGNLINLSAPGYIMVLQDGRKPTSPGASKGDPTLYESLIPWFNAKGIPEFENNEKGKEVNLWWAITESIHKKGFKGTEGIISDPLSDENINKVLNEFLEPAVDTTTKQLLEIFTPLDNL